MAKNERKIRIFSALEVANICGVVNQTAINWIRNGHLKAFTTPGGQYRVYAEDLSSFLDKRGMRIPDEVTNILKRDIDWDTMLIVDDDRELNDLLKRWVEKKLPKYRIIQAYDGFEAGKELIASKPGFIILDIDLPGIDGYELCRKIKEDPSLGKPFVIIITGLDIPKERKDVISNWADAYLAKPLNFNSLASEILELEKKVVEKAYI
ncbi:response regulator [Breznakiella homolactica]|uniref:Response regulator n=1 Tax=Breznakiella homolactica TaxID=2798577 RepID=A0A7T8BB62_9SPIR|nr:response regulator [Breznakiella homolactica]QQO09695.1 response regulator [Breznakiella homolactica]